MTAILEESGHSFASNWSFRSDGTQDPLGSTRSFEDVFATSLADIDVWASNSPKNTKPKISLSSSNSKRAQERRNKQSHGEHRHTKRSSDRKRSSKSGKERRMTSKRSLCSTPESQEEIFETFGDFSSINSQDVLLQTSREAAPLEIIDETDGVGELMALIERENETKGLPERNKSSKSSSSRVRSKSPSRHGRSSKSEGQYTSRRASEPPSSIRGDLKKILLENKNHSKSQKSYLSKRRSKEVTKERREGVRASLGSFLMEQEDIPQKLGDRSVSSAPTVVGSKRREKSRSSRHLCGGGRSHRRSSDKPKGMLDDHLRSNRSKRSGGSSGSRSVQSAPNNAHYNEEEIHEKMKSFKLKF